ncbi:MAG TPA: uroporphyrinogen-III synthase [Bacillota bacterium]|nr:uroporphyrinogen-III synthase [Bacillota bacterium]
MIAVKPLTGKTVLVTRSRKQASELVRRIEELGGEVIEFPVIEIVPPNNADPMDKAITNLHLFDWVIFTSGNGAECFFQRVKELNIDFHAYKIAVVGPKTAEVIRQWGKEPDLIARDFKAEGLLEELLQVLTGKEQILFPRSSIARPLLAAELSRKGIQVTEVDAYDTVMAVEKGMDVFSALENKSIDYITFTSSSTVKNFCEAIPKESIEGLLKGIGIVCIGPITAQTAVNYQLEISAIAEEHTIDGLIDVLVKNAIH